VITIEDYQVLITWNLDPMGLIGDEDSFGRVVND